MSAALERACAYGVTVVVADLGEWGPSCALYSEYDSRAAQIRINRRVIDRLDESQREEFVATCVGHELYHHREAIGEIVRLRDRREREAAADAFARSLAAQRSRY